MFRAGETRKELVKYYSELSSKFGEENVYALVEVPTEKLKQDKSQFMSKLQKFSAEYKASLLGHQYYQELYQRMRSPIKK